MESDVGRRIRAARAYAGITSQGALGKKLDWSQSTMQRVESGARDLGPVERKLYLSEIAEVCGLPYEWFTADFQRLAEIAPDDASQLEQTKAELAELEEGKGQPGDDSSERPDAETGDEGSTGMSP